MNIKKGVDIRFLRPEIAQKLFNIEAIFCWHLPESYAFTLTAGADGKHREGSKHYKDLAIDIRIWWMGKDTDGKRKQMYASNDQRDHILADLTKLLGHDDYDLVWHTGSHLHIEFDP